jgi:hypothetical protein
MDFMAAKDLHLEGIFTKPNNSYKRLSDPSPRLFATHTLYSVGPWSIP